MRNSAQKVTGSAAEAVPFAAGRLGAGRHQRASCPRANPGPRSPLLTQLHPSHFLQIQLSKYIFGLSWGLGKGTNPPVSPKGQEKDEPNIKSLSKSGF